MLCLVSIHDNAVSMFERPTGAARLQHNRISTQFINAHLHRGARAQTGIEKDQGHRRAGEQLCLVVAVLEAQRRVDELIEFAARQRGRS